MKRDRLKHRKQASCCGHARDLKGEGKSVLAEGGILAQGLPASSTLLGVRNKAVPFVCVWGGGMTGTREVKCLDILVELESTLRILRFLQ